MKIDLDQFMALTLALGAVGAVGTAAYVTHLDAQTAAADRAAVEAAKRAEAEADDEELPEAPPSPVEVATPTPVPQGIGEPALPADDVTAEEDLTQVPAPYSEGAWMNS